MGEVRWTHGGGRDLVWYILLVSLSRSTCECDGAIWDGTMGRHHGTNGSPVQSGVGIRRRVGPTAFRGRQCLDVYLPVRRVECEQEIGAFAWSYYYSYDRVLC